MDELISFLKEKYIEDVVAPLDLHRLAIFLALVGALRLIPSEDASYASIWKVIGETRILSVFDSQGNVWSEITVSHVLISVILTIFISLSYRHVKSGLFQLFSKIKSIDAYLEGLLERIRGQLTGNKAVDLLLVKDLSGDLSVRKKQLIGLHAWGEVCMACVVISLVGLIRRVNLVDSGLVITFSCTLLVVQWQAYLYYLEKVLPVALPEKILRENSFRAECEY
jgi:hypothetical protein